MGNPSKLTHLAANWWADRWQENETREQFRQALLENLPENDFNTYSDYDPSDLLLEIVRKVKPECRGCAFSSQGILPQKTGLQRKGNELICKEGYGAPFIKITSEQRSAKS